VRKKALRLQALQKERTEALQKEDTEARQKEYDEELKNLSDAENATIGKFGGVVLAMASAGLGLSLVFIKELVASASPVHLWALVTGWIGLVAAVTLSVGDYFASFFSTRKAYDNLDDFFIRGSIDRDQYQRTAQGRGFWADVFNSVEALAFLVGILSLAWFIGSNTLRELRARAPDASNSVHTSVLKAAPRPIAVPVSTDEQRVPVTQEMRASSSH
jgi:hypothetical protein